MISTLVTVFDFLHFVAHIPTSTKLQGHENDYFCIFLLENLFPFTIYDSKPTSVYNIISTFKLINYVYKDLNKLPLGHHIFNYRKEKRGFLELITSDFMHMCYANTFQVCL